MKKQYKPGKTDDLKKLAGTCPDAASTEQRKLRPRRPISIAPGDLPDDALVDKSIRRAVTGLGDSQTYELIKKQRFPSPLKLGVRCSRWRMGDLRRWLADPLGYRAA